MISHAVEYSLRAMVLLAQNADKPLTVPKIATEGQIPAPYLAKLMQQMKRAGLITSQRGVGGGFLLAHHPAEITLAEIVNVVEPIRRIKECPLGITGHVTLCPLHHKLDQVLAMTEQAFYGTTLKDLCREDGGSIPLCSSQSETLKRSVSTDLE
jgi:Rrf2 family nitric oxide-sensitive transcriptional repressor